MRHALGWIIGIALAAGCSAEDQRKGRTCTAADCSDGVYLSLQRPTSQALLALSEGEYELEIQYDDVSDVCTGIASQVDVPLACGNRTAHSGGYFRGPDNSAVGIGLRIDNRTPTSVSVALRREGTTILSEVFELAYSEVAPNGIECGPVCQRATIEATLPREE